MSQLDGRVAFITGAARGQGRSHAVTLAEHGADVVALDICGPVEQGIAPPASREDLEETKRLVEATGRACEIAVADVRDSKAMEAAARAANERFGKVDIVVANAGIVAMKRDQTTWEQSEEDFRATLDVNLVGAWNTVRFLIPGMAERRSGAIVLTASTAGMRGFPNAGSYTASKHGVLGLMRSLAIELAPYRVRVNAICPTTVETPLVFNENLKAIFEGDGPELSRDEYYRQHAGSNLFPVLLEPDDVSQGVLYLVSDAGRYVTGVAHPVDAGFLTKWSLTYEAPDYGEESSG